MTDVEPGQRDMLVPFSPENRRKHFQLWPLKATAVMFILFVCAGFFLGLVASPGIFMSRPIKPAPLIAVFIVLGILALLVGIIFFQVVRGAVRWLLDAILRQKIIIHGQLLRIIKSKGSRAIQVNGRKYNIRFQDWHDLAGIKPGDKVEIHAARFSGSVLDIFKK